ncbi:MAG: family 43 glycosylhydrolase [Bacteroidaceae bacterium]|nr:family 43 glycosylhydrolase [Bacteroidaceae bacterium]
MRRLNLFVWAVMFAAGLCAQVEKPLPTLHVEGKWLCDSHGNHVVLHGVMDTPSMYFNGGRWGWGEYNDDAATRCKNYFEKIFAGLEQANCDVFRLHMDPAWTNDPSSSYTYSGSVGQPEGTGGEADISKFNPTRYKKFLTSVYWPLMQKAMNHKMYVVVRPPGVCPGNLKVGDYYNDYLMYVWDIFSQNTNIKKYAGQISIELANEPVSLKNAEGQDDPKALHDYFQPIVDKIRANGFSGIIWAPGTGWQANYTSYAEYPIEGANIGYAVHDYTGWYGCSDSHPNPQDKINQFRKQVPVVDFAPVIITEVDWSPENPDAEGHYNEHGDWVQPNYGTWSTGSTSKWGKAYKACLDYYGNISMTLSGTHCLIDVDTLIDKKKVVPAFDGLEEACGKACMDWYAEYYNVDWAHPDYKNVSLSDQGTGRYKNPVVFADFPDPDVIRVEDTYYMVSTTMHHFPGATILKSKDLVNWDYCAQPLEQLSAKDRYSLQNGENAYAAGMWACSMKYHNGKFYLLINGNDAGGFVLTATDPEGHWEKKALSRIYYDPGMLFDNGKVYVACGINDIKICELDEQFNFKQEKTVVTRENSGLEGCHLYKIGDYYYIYATYGGWPTAQVAFRSTNIFGPYEEKVLLEKSINNTANTIHQGALIETQTGEWWTIMQQDLGCLGRMPNLQPVTWDDGWPIVGNKGVPYTAYTKPKTGTASPRTGLPTNDNFRSYPLGMQWEWNHNPDDGAWSLFERPGWLRLRAASITDRLTQARNMLTQRIFAFHDKASTPSIGTIRLDVRNLQEGDRAGICIFQDPYAAIAVEVKDGKRQLVWWQDTLRVDNSFTPTQQTQEVQVDSIIYLRAAVTYGTSKTQFSYSLDNETFTPLGDQTTLKYSLTVFVGARFGLFCYNTASGSNGYADFDWFSTEAAFDESKYFPADFEGFNKDMLTAETLEMEVDEMEVMVGNSKPLKLTATFADGHTEDVAAKASYIMDVDGVVTFQNGMVRGLEEGSTVVTVVYADPLGNEFRRVLNVRSTFFPFGAEYINTSLFSQGTYTEKTRLFKFGQYGQMGWEYPSGADMSGYKYLVLKMKKTNTAAHINLFTSGSIWGDCCATPDFGSNKQIVLDLREAKYTSDDRTGEPLDTKNIRIVSFWCNNGTIVVDDMYLTNNDDYSRGTPDGIGELFDEEMVNGKWSNGEWYDLSGRRITEPLHGLNIIRYPDGTAKKILIK